MSPTFSFVNHHLVHQQGDGSWMRVESNRVHLKLSDFFLKQMYDGSIPAFGTEDVSYFDWNTRMLARCPVLTYKIIFHLDIPCATCHWDMNSLVHLYAIILYKMLPIVHLICVM